MGELWVFTTEMWHPYTWQNVWLVLSEGNAGYYALVSPVSFLEDWNPVYGVEGLSTQTLLLKIEHWDWYSVRPVCGAQGVNVQIQIQGGNNEQLNVCFSQVALTVKLTLVSQMRQDAWKFSESTLRTWSSEMMWISNRYGTVAMVSPVLQYCALDDHVVFVFGQIAAETHGYVGSDVASLCSEAALQQVLCHSKQLVKLTVDNGIFLIWNRSV